MTTCDGVSIVIPAHNEEGSLCSTVEALRNAFSTVGLPCEIIVVDDGSTDGTLAAARALTGITLLRNRTNVGYGGTLKKGIGAAGYDVVVIIDADGSYPCARVPDLVRLLEPDVNMVVGWRKGADAKIPLERRPAKWMVKKFAESLAGYEIPDINSGLRVFRRSFVMTHRNLFPQGFSFTTTLTLLIASGGGSIVYEPIEYLRRVGKSKFHPIRDTWNMLTLIVRAVMLFNPLRVFFPVAMVLFLLGSFFALLSYLTPATYRASTTILVTSGLLCLGMGLLADLVNRRAPN